MIANRDIVVIGGLAGPIVPLKTILCNCVRTFPL